MKASGSAREVEGSRQCHIVMQNFKYSSALLILYNVWKEGCSGTIGTTTLPVCGERNNNNNNNNEVRLSSTKEGAICATYFFFFCLSRIMSEILVYFGMQTINIYANMTS